MTLSLIVLWYLFITQVRLSQGKIFTFLLLHAHIKGFADCERLFYEITIVLNHCFATWPWGNLHLQMLKAAVCL